MTVWIGGFGFPVTIEPREDCGSCKTDPTGRCVAHEECDREERNR